MFEMRIRLPHRYHRRVTVKEHLFGPTCKQQYGLAFDCISFSIGALDTLPPINKTNQFKNRQLFVKFVFTIDAKPNTRKTAPECRLTNHLFRLLMKFDECQKLFQ